MRLPLENKTFQTITNHFFLAFHKPNLKPSLSETDDGQEYRNQFFTDFLMSKFFKRYTK